MTALELSKQRLAEAKKKSLVDLLKLEGYEINDTGSYYRCLSPLRNEGNGSFDISKKSGKWKDRGKDKCSGDTVDFVMLYKHMSFKEAVDFLLGGKAMDVPVYVPEKRERENVEITTVEPLSEPWLIRYIASREISPDIASQYLKQLKIRFPYSKKDPDAIYTVLGWANDSGGYEMRSKGIKISNKPKNITTIKGVLDDNIVINLFEGWPDFQSYLTYYGYMTPPYKTVVLNSISFLDMLIPMLQGKMVYYFGQNDKAGQRAYRRLKNEGIVVIDKRHIFKGYKDFNEYMVKHSKKRLSKIINSIYGNKNKDKENSKEKV